jgi:hypothetical protein
MTPLSPARRAADEFASVVDGTRVDVADRYADLVDVVGALRTQEAPAPRPDFVANLRERLMDAADTLLIPVERTAPANVVAFPDVARRRQRRLNVAAAALVIVGGTAGVAAAAESSLPGDPLYPIKRGIESARVNFNSSESGKGQDLLRQASTRLDEVDGLLGSDSSADRITDTLGSFQDSAIDGADLIFVAYQRSNDPDDITRLRAVLASQLNLLDDLAGRAPEGTDSAFDQARALIADLDQQARVLCGQCGSGATAGLLPTASAPLVTLLTAPAEQVRAAAEAEKNAELAGAAGDVADDTPAKSPDADPTQTPGTSPSPSPTKGGLPVLPGVGDDPVTDALTDVASDVGELLEQLTQPLNDTLGGLGSGLTSLGKNLTQ